MLGGGSLSELFTPFNTHHTTQRTWAASSPLDRGEAEPSPIPQSAEVIKWPVGHSNHHLPISTGSSFLADTQSSGLCDQINTGCYLHGRHETHLKTGFTGNRTRDGAREHSRELPSLSGNQATSPRSRLQQGVSAMGLGLVLCRDPSGLEENAPFP